MFQENMIMLIAQTKREKTDKDESIGPTRAYLGSKRAFTWMPRSDWNYEGRRDRSRRLGCGKVRGLWKGVPLPPEERFERGLGHPQ